MVIKRADEKIVSPYLFKITSLVAAIYRAGIIKIINETSAVPRFSDSQTDRDEEI